MQQLKLNEQQQKYIKTIASSAQNILFIVNDVLDLSKIEKGELKFENIPVNINEICQQIVASLIFKRFEKNVEIKSEIDKNVPLYILGDPVRINQILLNLADNALKFTKEGMVKITIQKQETHSENTVTLSFSVSDSGIGIEESMLEKIFDSYQQAHISTTRQFGGTGLGLSISKLLVEKMGGKLSVESILNEGSTFSFTLTFETCNATNFENDGIVAAENSLSNCSILVVDDNQLNLELFYDLINNPLKNVSVTMASNGKEALSIFEKNDFDIILMDIQMPEMDGYETTKIIRSSLSVPKKNIPIIAMTAHVLEGVHQKCIDVGMNDTIAKPINTNILTSKIKEFCQQSTMEFRQSSTNPKHENASNELNLSTLQELTNNDSAKINKYLLLFQKNLPLDLSDLEQAVKSQNRENIATISHKIKGSLVYLNATSIYDEIKFLEGIEEESVDENEINSVFSVIQTEIILILERINTLTQE